jgi:hypothetical protein
MTDIVHFDFGMNSRDRQRVMSNRLREQAGEAPIGAACTDNEEPFPRARDIIHEFTPASLRVEDFPPCIGDYAGLQALATGHDVSGYLLAFTVAMAGAMDDGLRLELNAETAHHTSARLWGLIAGKSGSGKTPMLKAACEPLRSEELRLRRPDLVPIASDITTEKLRDVLIEQPRGILFVTDEFEAWMGQHDAYKKSSSGSGDRALWLQLFEGGPQYIDRVGTGAKKVPNWGASLLSATTLVGLSRLKLPADGLLQRFLSVVIRRPETAAPVDAGTLRTARNQYTHRVIALAEAPPVAGVLVVHMTPEAAAIYRSQQEQVGSMIDAAEALSEGFASHCAKYAEFIGRLALTFHAATIDGPVTPASIAAEPLVADTMRIAVRAAEGFRRHGLALHTHIKGGSPALELAKQMALSILADDPRSTMRRTDMANSCTAFRNASRDLRRDAIEYLELVGWLRPGPDRYSGEPSNYYVNPEVFDRFAPYGSQHLARREVVKQMILQS